MHTMHKITAGIQSITPSNPFGQEDDWRTPTPIMTPACTAAVVPHANRKTLDINALNPSLCLWWDTSASDSRLLDGLSRAES
mmetsp:Transcript_17272/g.39949  ORF Transcript_17272/g.39949 Transcript_17272/m.39949 type:complete len:82 (-) Transcript_17272:150-395(-)